MKYTFVRVSDYNTYEECMEAIEEIEMNPENIVGGSKAFYSGFQTELLKGAQNKIDALNRRADKFNVCEPEDDEEEEQTMIEEQNQIDVEEVTDAVGQQVGYVRVSAVDQNTDRQLSGVKLDRTFEEKLSAKTTDRPQLTACLEYVRAGDTLHIHSLDRVCRSGAGDAVALVERMAAKGVTVQFHKEGMRFDGAMSAAQKGVLSILAAVAQMERELIRERQAEGIAAAKAAGKHMGRPKKSVSKADVLELEEQGMNRSTIAKKLGIGRTTLYRLMEAE